MVTEKGTGRNNEKNQYLNSQPEMQICVQCTVEAGFTLYVIYLTHKLATNKAK